MNAIKPRPRTPDTITAELRSAHDYRWQLLRLAADFHNCQPLQPIIVVVGGPPIPREPPALSPELSEALRLSAETIALLERELYDAYQTQYNDNYQRHLQEMMAQRVPRALR